MYVWYGSTNSVCYTNVVNMTYSVTNDYSAGVLVEMMGDSQCTPLGQGGINPYRWLQPGEVWSYAVSFATNSCDGSVVMGTDPRVNGGGIYVIGDNLDGISFYGNGGYTLVQGDGCSGPVGGYTATTTPYRGPSSNGGPVSTNNPVDYTSASNGVALDVGTFQRGIAGVVNEIRTQGQSSREGLNQVSADVRALDAANVAGFAAVTNTVGRAAYDISNAVAGVTETLTNLFRTNAPAIGDSSLTNYDSAEAIAEGALSSSLGSMSGFTNEVGGVGGSDFADSIPSWVVNIPISTAGATVPLDFNPLHNADAVSIFSMARRFIAWLLVLGYLTLVCHDAVEWIDKLGTKRGQSVQDMNVLGTNLLGALLALILPVVWLVGYAVVLALVFAVPFGAISFDGGSLFDLLHSNPLQGGPTGVYTLFTSVFPFRMFCALVTGYLLWKLSVGRAMLIYSAVARVLLGG